MSRGAKGVWGRIAPIVLALSLAGAAWISGASALAAEEADAQARACFQELRERMRHQMDVELEALTRICSLNEKQRQRLEVAARGVVERVLEDREKAPDPDDPVEWRWEEEGSPVAAKAGLLRHPLWCATIREVLTDAQVKALEQEQAAVSGCRREAAIRLATCLLQEELRLTEEQRRKMETLLEEMLPAEYFEPEPDAAAFAHWLEREEVEKLLTKTQFACWLDLQRSLAGAEDRLLIR